MKILVTGGNGNIAKIIHRKLYSDNYKIINLSRQDLNVLNLEDIKQYLEKNNFDILVHNAILGGRRTKEDTGEVTHLNLLMLENLLKFSDKFKMIINLDSGAIYDRNTDILNRNEVELFTIPTDYYGFSKYVIYKRTLQYDNIYNFRIFNIFHPDEEPDRFIKKCFFAKRDNLNVDIFEDKYFDFVYEDDFCKIAKYYFDNIDSQVNLKKTINICYEQKYKLSDIAKIILNDDNKINIINKNVNNRNYSGDFSELKTLNIDLQGLETSLKLYKKKIDSIYINKKYAVCMYGQLRAVETTIEKLYDNLVKPFDADLFVMAQTTGTDIDKNINLFKTKNKIIYEAPDCTNIFINYHNLLRNNNYIDIAALNVYYNWYKINETFGNIFEENYEYVILSRTDYLHLFPFPDITSLYEKDDLFWCYDGHEWGGINVTQVCIPSKYIKNYLCCAYNYLQDSNNIERFNNMSHCLNAETFFKIMFDDKNWKIGKIQPNAFITASNNSEITTWGQITYSHEHKVFYKYHDQLNRAFNSLKQYNNNNNKWSLIFLNDNYKIILTH
jgi:GDP-L-fucose synthase